MPGKTAYIDNAGNLRQTNRFGKDRFEWTADKLLKGAGSGSDLGECWNDILNYHFTIA